MRNGFQEFLAQIYTQIPNGSKRSKKVLSGARFKGARRMVSLFFAASIGFASLASAKGTAGGPKADFLPGEVVAKLRSATIMTQAQERESLVKGLRSLGVTAVNPLQTDARYVRITFGGNQTMSGFLRNLRRNRAIVYAEPNYIYRASPVRPDVESILRNLRRSLRANGYQPRNEGRSPDDPDFGKTWGLLNSGQADSSGQAGTSGVDIDATLAWNIGTGSRDVLVAIIDTGIDYTHPDLAANIWTNPREIAGNGVDDDGNGFVDDVHGYNFQGKDGDPMDDNKHGTHCAGTIGAVGDNGIGVAGVAWNVSLMGVKFLSASGGGSLADAVDSIKYATKMHVNVMSNSWGGGGRSQTLEDAIKEARDAGILFVAAAGNESNNNDNRPSYPASYQLDNVISVAATDNKDVMARWSNYGSRMVHLAAPGVNIYSSTPNGSYENLSGTSMATPHVSGAAALLWSLNRNWRYSDIRARLLATVDPVKTLASKTTSGGRLNINNAIHNIVQPKDAPEEEAWSAMADFKESSHEYSDDEDTHVEISYPGAQYIRVHFSRVSVEQDYDYVRVLSPDGEEFDSLTGDVDDHTSNYVPGDTLYINLTSDSSNTGWGWAIDRIEYVM